jgi:hypothetical protein
VPFSLTNNFNNKQQQQQQQQPQQQKQQHLHPNASDVWLNNKNNKNDAIDIRIAVLKELVLLLLDRPFFGLSGLAKLRYFRSQYEVGGVPN